MTAQGKPLGELRPEDAKGLAAAFIARTDEKFQQPLDFSVSSLKGLDNLLQDVHDRGVKPAEVRAFVLEASCYLGEVMRLHGGCEWVAVDPDQAPEEVNFSLAMTRGQTWLVPYAKIAKRIVQGPSESIPEYFRILQEQAAPGGQDGAIH